MIDTKKHNHAEKRKVLAQALSETSLKSIEENTLSIVNRFCQLLIGEGQQYGQPSRTDWTSSVDIGLLYRYLSFDVMGQVCFGHTFDMLAKADNRYMLDVISNGALCLNTVCSFLPLCRTMTEWS